MGMMYHHTIANLGLARIDTRPHSHDFSARLMTGDHGAA
jgi:hypothetical protein